MFKVSELVKATQGKLIQGDPRKITGGISTDSRKLKSGEVFLAIKGDNFNGHDFIARAALLKAGCIICERVKGVIPPAIAVIRVADTTIALGDIARFARLKFSLPVIAVTGSNGKTTTKDMLAWVLSGSGKTLKNEGSRNNHIGLPQTLLKVCAKDRYAVLEIGTNHFGEVKYLSDICLPQVGVITNVGHAHLEFFKDLKGVFKEKSSLLDNLKGARIAVLNADDSHLRRLTAAPARNKLPVFSFAINSPADFKASSVRIEGNRVSFKVNGKFPFLLDTPGRHNIYNALAAVAIGRIFGLSYARISKRLAAFTFPKGRLKAIRVRGLNFIDDTYNANPLSLYRSLETLNDMRAAGRKVLVLGDMLELGAQKESLHKEIAGSITNICDIFIACGKLACLAAAAAEKNGFKKENIFCCSNSLKARKLVFQNGLLCKDDLILVKGSRGMHMEEVFKV